MNKKLKGRKIREYQERQTKKANIKVANVFKRFANSFQNSNKFADKFDIDYDSFEADMKKTLSSVYGANANDTTKFMNSLFGWKLKVDVLKSVSNKSLQEYNKKYSALKVTRITETTRNTLQSIIENGQREGLNKEVIAQEIYNRIDEMSIGRARTIARTETSGAVQNTTRDTAETAGMEKKTWIYTDAAKVPRANHQALDGESIGIDELFDLGGETCLYPHDPNLSAEESINCHCICIYE